MKDISKLILRDCNYRNIKSPNEIYIAPCKIPATVISNLGARIRGAYSYLKIEVTFFLCNVTALLKAISNPIPRGRKYRNIKSSDGQCAVILELALTVIAN